jgi:hypothetical protein
VKKSWTLLVVLLFAGCSTAYITGKAPFPRSSVVTEHTSSELRAHVEEQEAFWRNPPESNMLLFKHYPTAEEFAKLQAAFRDGDRIVEFKNEDWFVGIDRMSQSAEYAFCLVRDDKTVMNVKIWPSDMPSVPKKKEANQSPQTTTGSSAPDRV